MHPLLVSLIMAESSLEAVKPKVYSANNIVRDLPGRLDNTLVLYSNSPELVLTPGILVSTYPTAGKRVKSAHLNKLIAGRFDVFTHHVAQRNNSGKVLYQAVLLTNPGKKTAVVTIKQAVSCATSPDAPFYKLPPLCDNSSGRVFAGPGDRMADVINRGLTQGGWPQKITLPPGETRLLFSLPIPVIGSRSRNTRSTLIRAQTSAPIYAASLCTFTTGAPPSLAQWQNYLNTAPLAGPRDKRPSRPSTSASPIYGRVAGVSKGSVWTGNFTDDPHGSLRLSLPPAGRSISYVVSTLEQGAFGTKQLQSAPLVARYNDTSYKVHGNYAVEYNLFVPLHNDTALSQNVSLTLQTPLKSNTSKSGLYFTVPPLNNIWFRGTLRLRYRDDAGILVDRFLHVVQKQGDSGMPLLTVNVRPAETRMVSVDFIYPPDCTPPQILTITTNQNSLNAEQSIEQTPDNSTETGQ